MLLNPGRPPTDDQAIYSHQPACIALWGSKHGSKAFTERAYKSHRQVLAKSKRQESRCGSRGLRGAPVLYVLIAFSAVFSGPPAFAGVSGNRGFRVG